MLKRFISYYKPYKGVFFLDMLASLIISLVGIGYPILTNKILDEYIPEKNIRLIVILSICLLGCYVIRMLLRFFVQYYGHVIGVKMQADMRRDMFRKLEKLPFSYYDEHETGKIMSRMTNDLMEVSELAHHGPENVFICGATVIISFVYLLTINWMFTLFVFGCVPFLVIITLVLRKKMGKAFTKTRESVAVINSSLESSITGIRVTKAFTNEKLELTKFEEGNKEYVKSRSFAYKAMGQFASSTQFITDVFNVVILLVGGLLVAFEKIDIVAYTTFVISVNLFINPLNTLINFTEQYQNGVTGFKRFVEIIDEKEETTNPNAVELSGFNGDIVFDHVCFEYDTKKDILNDVSFVIPKGQKVALVGASGGGKTTICHLIPNFYQTTSGRILIDGHNINDITFTSLRSNIGLVQQDVFLFNGSILENIKYAKLDATMDEVILAATRANIHDYITSLPDGYNTLIGERGVKLSGGQKQRISIARVFLKNPDILILDEATSALDNETEILIQQALDELCKNRTTIVVAHRLSTIKNADMIFVVNHGEIVEKGSHKELMAKNGEYKVLYEAQFRKKEDK